LNCIKLNYKQLKKKDRAKTIINLLVDINDKFKIRTTSPSKLYVKGPPKLATIKINQKILNILLLFNHGLLNNRRIFNHGLLNILLLFNNP